jgi:hypothetical protein
VEEVITSIMADNPNVMVNMDNADIMESKIGDTVEDTALPNLFSSSL